MKIWAHRGCSQMYPENTLLAFSKAMQIEGLTGIELDLQLTKDNQLVVIHDEKLDRTTNGKGFVKDFTLKEIKSFNISVVQSGKKAEKIPTFEEVLDLLEQSMKKGLMLNIELKNNVIEYSGMEEIITTIINKRNLEKCIIYSTFNMYSVKKLRNLVPDAQIGILDKKLSDCLDKMKDQCGADALHPFWKGIDLTKEELERSLQAVGNCKNVPVRAWFTGHLYPEEPTGNKLELLSLERQGITDVFLNEPERYLCNM